MGYAVSVSAGLGRSGMSCDTDARNSLDSEAGFLESAGCVPSIAGRALGELPPQTQDALKRLRQRAIRLLARRDHSQKELGRKLASEPVPRRRRRGEGDVAPAGDHTDESPGLPPLTDRIAWVLADLAARGYLDDGRFATSLVRRESARHGVLLIERRLAETGISGADAEPFLAEARGREFESALALWKRRFGTPPSDLRERARQARYLANRGFSPEVVHRIVGRRGHLEED